MKKISFPKLKLTFNAPVVLTFGAICLVTLILSMLTGGVTNKLLFSTYHSSLANPLTYLRFFTHVCGHSSWTHFLGNMSYILLLGPLLEEKYGSKMLVWVILFTALSTSLLNYILFPHSGLLGASGVVFAFILLSSITGLKEGEIPITFVLVAIIYIGEQVYDGIFLTDNISNMAHIVGGVVGTIIGFAVGKRRS